MKRFCLFALVLVSNQLFAQSGYNSFLKDARAVPREHSVDITHMSLDVTFEPRAGLVKGKVVHTFKPLRAKVDTIFFDGPGIRIKSATIDGKPLEYKTIAEGITVYFQTPLVWDRTHKITFEYEANPRKGIYFIGWNDPAQKSRKQIWTQGQGIDHRNWIPMYDDMDDKFVTETKVTFDKAYKVLGNGKKIKETTNNDGTKTWHYAMSKPHAGYLLMLAIGDYAIKSTKSASGVPIQFWYYPDKLDWLEPTSRHTEKMMDFLERHIGVKYPWESYSQVMVQDFLYGAMENTTATIFGDFFACDNRSFLDRNYVGVNCHEMTHQWFGDLITARSGADTWLQESFATFYPKLFGRELNGEDAYQWNRRSEQNSALNASLKDKIPVRNTGAGTARVYQKGSAILDMMMYVLGEDAYRRVIKHYLEEHAYANVESNDLLQAVHDVTGQSLNWFFEQWLYRGGEPHYEISWSGTVQGENKFTTVNVKQAHAMDEVIGLFKMPVVFEVHYADGSTETITEWIKDASHTINIPNKGGKSVSYVLFDPGSYILKTVTFKRTYDELSAQLEGAKNMIDRYDALLELKSIPLDKKRELLQRVFDKEGSPYIRAELITQLGDDGDKSNSYLKKGMKDSRLEVRTSAVNAMKTKAAIKELEALLRDSSYALIASTLEKACNLDPQNAQKYLKACEGVEGQTNNVRIKWLEYNLKYPAERVGGTEQVTDRDHKNALFDLTSPSQEFRTRVSAFQAAKSVGIIDAILVGNMFDAMLSTNGRLANPTAEVFEYYANNWQNKKLIREVFNGLPEEQRKYLMNAFAAVRNL